MPTSTASEFESRLPHHDLEGRFALANRARLRRARDTLTPRQQDFLDLLPLLFHINHPLLPGYVSRDTPAGIVNYSPADRSTLAAKRVSRSFAYNRRILQRPAIRGIYLMGSPGTIGYSRGSDLDVWLCHGSSLSAHRIAQLEQKTRLVERFGANLGLEIHFFVFDPERFRGGETISLSDQSSGSSQRFLLLDEFYRSGLLVAGASPLWWRVPPEHEQRYDDWVAEIKARCLVNEADYVDFGGLTHIPAEEFFGAAVWHLYKSISSPYKSALKLMLMEVYADGYPNSALLSHCYKRTIADRNVNLDDVDPYMLMYSKVEQYLTANSDPTRLNLLRRSFYLKVDERLSTTPPPGQSSWKRDILEGLVRSWGWDSKKISRLDQRDRWKIETALDERRDLIRVLQQSYARLSDFARSHATNKIISQTDLNLLGRKLYAAFEKKPGKIDIVTRGICPNPLEPDLSLHRAGHAWILYKGAVMPDECDHHVPLKRSRSVVEILIWCQLNRIVNRSTNWHLYVPGSVIALSEVRRTLDAVAECFPSNPVNESISEALSEQPRIEQALLLVNAGVDPLADRIRNGSVLMSNKTDAFQFGGQRLSLVKAVDLAITTNWEEIFTFHYTGTRGLLEALLEYLRWSPRPGRTDLPAVRVNSFSQDYAGAIRRRVDSFFRAVVGFLSEHTDPGPLHYVVEIEDRIYRICSGHQTVRYEAHRNYAGLVKALGRSGRGFTRVRFDESCHRAGVLAAIYGANLRSTIQVFAQTRGTKTDIYILDEHGALFVQRREACDVASLFEQYHRFLTAVSRQSAYLPDAEPVEFGSPDIAFYELITAAGGAVTARPYHLGLRAPAEYWSLRVFGDVDPDGRPHFTFLCNDAEFSSLEHGSALFAVIARFVLSRRKDGQAYPVYITDLELSTRFRQSHGINTQHTIDLLNYKKRIEYQLTRALRQELAAVRPSPPLR